MSKEKCFVITPIGDDLDPIRRHIDGIIKAAIKPALEERYEIIVSHKINAPGSLNKQIIKEIYESKLVIANITNRNPNVMYELGFRHTLGKPVIMIAEKGTNLPADIISERTIFYHNDALGTLELMTAIVNAEKEINFDKPSGPLYDELGEIKHELDLLDQKVEKEISDSEPLIYILQRLDELETLIKENEGHSDRVRNSTGELQVNREAKIYKVIKAVYSYMNFYNNTNITNCLSDIRNKIEANIGITVFNMENDIENKRITLFMRVGKCNDIEQVYSLVMKIIMENGFSLVSLVNE